MANGMDGLDMQDPQVRALVSQILQTQDTGASPLGTAAQLGGNVLSMGALNNLQQGGEPGLMNAIGSIPDAFGMGSDPGPQPPTSPGSMSGSPTPVGQLGGAAAGGDDNSNLIRSLLMSRLGGMG